MAKPVARLHLPGSGSRHPAPCLAERCGDRPQRGAQVSSCRTSKEQDGNAQASQVVADTAVSRGMGRQAPGLLGGAGI